MISAEEALERLRSGNGRYVADLTGDKAPVSETRAALVGGQQPFAIVLGCSDSRVPVEQVFDQGPGDVFVIRVAGNVVDNHQIGSIEYAVAELGSPLIVVMGHTRCGAVKATIDAVAAPGTTFTPGIDSIVDRIRPSVEDLVKGEQEDAGELLKQAVRANVRTSVEHLRQGSDLLRQREEKNTLTIVGAEYSLETGAVDFFT